MPKRSNKLIRRTKLRKTIKLRRKQKSGRNNTFKFDAAKIHPASITI